MKKAAVAKNEITDLKDPEAARSALDELIKGYQQKKTHGAGSDPEDGMVAHSAK